MTKYIFKYQVLLILLLLKIYNANECKINVFASIIVEKQYSASDLSEYGFKKTCYCGEINKIVYTSGPSNLITNPGPNDYFLKLKYTPINKNDIGLLQICHSSNVGYMFIIFPNYEIPQIVFYLKPDGRNFVITIGDVKYYTVETKNKVINSIVVDTFRLCSPYLPSGSTIGCYLNQFHFVYIYLYNQCKCDDKAFNRKHIKEILELFEPIQKDYFFIKYLSLLYRSNEKRKTF